MSVAARLEVRGRDKSTLRRWARSTAIPAGLARRARIVLLAGEGVPNAEIARRVGVSRPTVIGWRERYLEGGTAALDDRPRPGRAKQIDESAVVVATLEKPPERLGVTHWSSRLLAREVGLGHATIARVWAKWNLQPWRVETFKFSTDPELDAKVRDVVGLYLHPPEKAVVLCVDEKSQVQALDLALLIDADDDCLLGRMHVQPDHVADLRVEFGIRAELEGLGPPGLQVPLGPD